ncbi:Protein GrpE [Frankliniella fusca]|uniref:Protein GrpE n=1 Tax=Frankliniella fusca TaxID=407009 RepID=A0AAE1H0I4_9NEOP|nr:Protein GrpE [Frankliniella fusca]
MLSIVTDSVKERGPCRQKPNLLKERTHAAVLVQGFERGHVLRAQLEVENVEVLPDPRLGHRLGNGDGAPLHLLMHTSNAAQENRVFDKGRPTYDYQSGGPLGRDSTHQGAQDDLPGGLAVAPADLRDGGVVQEPVHLAQAPVALRGAERAVGDDAHAQLLAEREQRRLRQVRVALDLVHHRPDAAVVHQAPQLALVEVGHADGAGQALAHELLHGAPRVQDVHVAEEHLAVGPEGLEVVAVPEGHRPVHQVQVDVVQAQVRQRLSAGALHGVRVMRVVPQLEAAKKTFTKFDSYLSPAVAELQFLDRVQRPGETAKEWLAALRRIAVFCDFGPDVNEKIRGQLVRGALDREARAKLTREGSEYTLAMCMDVLRAHEHSKLDPWLMIHLPSQPAQPTNAPPAQACFVLKSQQAGPGRANPWLVIYLPTVRSSQQHSPGAHGCPATGQAAFVVSSMQDDAPPGQTVFGARGRGGSVDELHPASTDTGTLEPPHSDAPTHVTPGEQHATGPPKRERGEDVTVLANGLTSDLGVHNATREASPYENKQYPPGARARAVWRALKHTKKAWRPRGCDGGATSPARAANWAEPLVLHASNDLFDEARSTMED